MGKLGKRLISAAKQAGAIARGEADPETYNVYVPSRRKKMSKAFDMIKAGLEDALALAEGRADKSRYGIHIPSQVDVKAIRRKLKMSQDEFAQRFCFTLARIRDWEQGRSKPDSAARAYLMVIAKERKAVERALKAG